MFKKGMKHLIHGLCAVTVLLCMSCNDRRPNTEEPKIGTSTVIEGDNTLYGLACSGCTDTVLVFLPGKGGDPVTYDILNATKRHRVIGQLKVGDWVAVLPNGTDSTVADMVINLDQLKGTWVELAMPKIRERAAELTVSEEQKAEIDSVLQSMMKPVEIGFALKRHYTAQPAGRQARNERRDDTDPLIYPASKNYTQWHVFNGRLILTSQSRHMNDSVEGEITNDTAEFIFMTPDSLRLRFKEGEKGFYRKTVKKS